MKQASLRTFLMMAATSLWAAAGSASAAPPATGHHIGVVQDWSTHTVVYTRVLTPQEARQRGANVMKQWMRNAQDPRFLVALMRRLNAKASQPLHPVALAAGKPQWWSPVSTKLTVARDWTTPLGSVGGVGTAGVYPAKYSFDINATPSCTSDFVVFPTDNPGSSATWKGTFSGEAATGDTVTVNGKVITAGTTTSATTFARSTNTTTEATNLAAAINITTNTAVTGVTATSAGAVVTLTYSVGGSGTSSTLVTESATNFALAFTAGHSDANIVAYNNLYKTTCTGTVPATFWSYNTGSGAITETSPVLSYYDNGAQVAFVQRNPGAGTATADQLQLVLLKWSASGGTSGAPTTPTTVTAANYRNCTAPCMTVFTFSGTSDIHAAASVSSPYVDYSNDVLWVGDGVGHLHKFTDIFTGTPAEAGSPFPVAVDANSNPLYSPVYDSTSNMVFIGSNDSTAAPVTGGKFSRVDASAGTVTASATLTPGDTSGVSSYPILDSSAQMVYVTVFGDIETTGNCNGGTAVPPCHRLFQFPTNFVAGANGTSGGTSGNAVQVGHGNVGNTTDILFEGTFDNAYLTTGAGNMYICGSEASTTSIKAMWKVPISVANVMGTPVAGATISGDDGTNGNICSSVTESLNGTHEYLYTSVEKESVGAATGSGACVTTNTSAGGCLYMFDLGNLQTATGATWVGSFASTGPTNGQTVVVNGITLTASTTNTLKNFLISNANTTGAREANAGNLAAAINRNVSGFTATPTNTTTTATVTITDSTTGSGVSSSLATETLTNFGPFTFTDGSSGSDWGTNDAPAASLPVIGGTGGVIIDNVSTATGAAQVYFSTLTSPGNAVQASQSQLQ